MDARSRATGRSGRTLLRAALLVLAGTMAAAYGRIFLGPEPAPRLVMAAGLAVTIGLVFERRHIAISVAASALGLLTVIGLFVFPSTTWYGLPTGGTLGSLVSALGNLGQRAVEETSPAPAVPALFSASLIAVWSAAYSAHALAARAASPVLGLIPPAALLGFANVVAEDGARLAYVIVFLLAALTVLFAAGLLQLGAWGPMLSQRSVTTFRVATGPPGRLARRLGVGATLVAVALPGLLPGFGDPAALDLDGGGGDRVAISPLVDIRPNLLRDPPLELFTVEADAPSYWRLQGLDEYSGRVWRSSDPEAARGVEVDGEALLDRPHTTRTGRSVSQRFELTGLGGKLIPAAYPAVEIAAPGLTLRHDAGRGVLLAPDGLPESYEYAVRSDVLVPTPEQLDRPFDFGAEELARYRSLPEDTPPQISAVAEELTAGVTSGFRKALAIQNYLRGFVYDVEVAVRHDFDDIIQFLRLGRGYCQQFAATMAVLLRALGYPARVAVGFVAGAPSDEGSFTVTTEDAHAWVEMFFPGYGWLPFEPTPGRSNPNARYLTPDPSFTDFPGGEDAPLETGLANPDLAHTRQRQLGPGSPPGGIAVADTVRQLEALGGRQDGPAAGEEPEGSFPTLLVVVLALLAAIPIAVLLVKWWRRRRLLAGAGSARELVLAAYDVLADRAEDVGLHRRTEETPHEYRDRLRATVRFSDGDLERLTALVGTAAYAPRTLEDADARDAIRAARAVGGDLRRHVGRRRAMIGALRPFPRD